MSKDSNNPNVNPISNPNPNPNVNPSFGQEKANDAGYAPSISAFIVTSTNDKTVTIEVQGKANKTLINARSENLMVDYTLAELYACIGLQMALKNGDLSAVDQNGTVIKSNTP